MTDYFLLCSGASSRQVQAIADSIEDNLRLIGVRYLGCEGRQSGRWLLMDYGEVIVHVFHHEVRQYYDLERLWGGAPRWQDDESEPRNLGEPPENAQISGAARGWNPDGEASGATAGRPE